MQSSSGFNSFIQTYGSLILAVYAILQVWMVALWKKYVRKGKLTIFEMGKILIGFGPTSMITLNGTFKADRKDLFIYEAKAVLTRETDGSTYNLDWLAFKAPTIKIGDPTATTLEVPSGIVVRLDQPIRYSIVFCDHKVHFGADSKLLGVKNAWKTFIQGNLIAIQGEIQKGEAEQLVIARYFEHFVKTSPEARSVVEYIESVQWLDEGEYTLKLEVKAADITTSFFEEWKFNLDKEASDRLKSNSVAVFEEVCLEKYDGYFSTVVDYVKAA